jgi:HemY protein
MLVFFALLLAAALGLAFLLETPGSVQLTYAGYEYRVTLAKAVAIVIALTVVLLIVWSIIRTLLRLPSLISLSNRMRRKARGYSAVSRGLVSVGVGDRRAATRFASEAERLLGREPVTLLLKAQAAQLAGDKRGAEAAFTKMLDNPETKVLGLRGLFIEARREGAQGARAYAEEAYRLAPASPWAGQAVLEYRTSDGNWRGAMAAIDESASRRVIDRDTARRQKATLLAAEALDSAGRNPDYALALASQALKLNPAHIAAVVLVARRLGAKGDYSKATRTIENAWKQIQHPELADAYLGVRHGDSTHDRLKRAKALVRLTPKSREAGLTLARAAIDAREFDLARETLEPLVLQEPTARSCRLMAELEDKAHGDAGLVRKWLARASQAPRDPAWVADGFVSDRWMPVSPVTGRIDAFEWKTPPQSLESSVRAAIDADQEALEQLPPPLQVEQPMLPEDVQAPSVDVPDPVSASIPSGVPVQEPPVAAPPVDPEAPESPTLPAGVLAHFPDDPGPRHGPPPRKKSRLFG